MRKLLIGSVFSLFTITMFGAGVAVRTDQNGSDFASPAAALINLLGNGNPGNGSGLTNIPNVNLPPMFGFGIDSRTSSNAVSGSNTWWLYFQTNVQQGNFFQSAIPSTNFFTIGIPSQLASVAYANLTNGTTVLRVVRPNQNAYFFWDGYVNDIGAGQTAVQIEATMTNAYNYLHGLGWNVVLVAPYINVPWPGSGSGWNANEAVNVWALTNKGIAWDYLMPARQILSPGNFGDPVHENASGNIIMGNLAVQTIFGTPNGVYSQSGSQITPDGLIIAKTTNTANPTVYDGRAQLRFDGTNLFVRLTPPGGDTNSYVDRNITGLFSGATAWNTSMQLIANTSDGGPNYTFSSVPDNSWRIGIGGTAGNKQFFLKNINGTGVDSIIVNFSDDRATFNGGIIAPTANFTGGVVTNNGLVWHSTNVTTPTFAYPNGSLATTTDGGFWIRTNSTWVRH